MKAWRTHKRPAASPCFLLIVAATHHTSPTFFTHHHGHYKTVLTIFFYFTTLSSGNRAFRYLPKMRFSLLSITMAALGSFTTAAAAAPLDARGVAVPAEGEWLEASVAQQRREALLESGLESRGLEGVSRSPSAVWENTHTHTHTTAPEFCLSERGSL